MKPTLILTFLLISVQNIFAQTTQPIHLQKGQLLAGAADTLYARVLPNEVLYIDCRVKGVKEGIDFKVVTMGDQEVYVKQGLKRERLRLSLKSSQEVVKIILHNPSDRIGKLYLQVDRISGESNALAIDQQIYWMDVVDTTYKWVDRPYYVYGDTSLVKVLDETRKVHSVGSVYENEDCVYIPLPEHTVKWSYYIGVDQAGSDAYQSAVSNMASMVGKLVDSPLQLTPLAGLMAYGMETITLLQRGEDIDFELLDKSGSIAYKNDNNTKPIVSGRIINGTRVLETPRSGEWFICLENDNAVTGVSVRVVIEALVLPYTVEMKKEKVVDNVSVRKSWFVK